MCKFFSGDNDRSIRANKRRIGKPISSQLSKSLFAHANFVAKIEIGCNGRQKCENCVRLISCPLQWETKFRRFTIQVEKV